MLHGSHDVEPHAEILVAHKTPERDGNKEHGKNPRFLQFLLHHDGADHRYEAHIAERGNIVRSLLRGLSPDPQVELSAEQLTAMQSWLAARYKRLALPNEFERRLVAVRERLYKILGKDQLHLSRIYCAVDPMQEQPKGKPYKLSLVAVMRKQHFAQAALRAKAQQSINEAEALLAKCDGINMKEIKLVSEEDVTIHDLRYLRAMNLEYVSHREGEGAIYPPEGA